MHARLIYIEKRRRSVTHRERIAEPGPRVDGAETAAPNQRSQAVARLQGRLPCGGWRKGKQRISVASLCRDPPRQPDTHTGCGLLANNNNENHARSLHSQKPPHVLLVVTRGARLLFGGIGGRRPFGTLVANRALSQEHGLVSRSLSGQDCLACACLCVCVWPLLPPPPRAPRNSFAFTNVPTPRRAEPMAGRAGGSREKTEPIRRGVCWGGKRRSSFRPPTGRGFETVEGEARTAMKTGRGAQQAGVL